MIDLAEKELKLAAEKCGISRDSVIRKTVNSPDFPEKRIELQFLKAGYTYDPELLSRDKNSSKTREMLKKAIYRENFYLTAQITGNNESWLKNFTKKFIKTIPVKTSDDQNNLVKIRVITSEFKGFDYNSPESPGDLSIILNIMFESFICIEDEIPLIPDAQLIPKLRRHDE